MLKAAAALTLIVGLMAAPVLAQTPQPRRHWAPAWIFPSSSDVGPSSPPRARRPGEPPDPRGPIGPRTVSNVTLVQTFVVAAGGDRVRLRVSNLHGAEPIRLSSVTLQPGLLDGRPGGNGKGVTFDGARELILPAGAVRLSDPVDLPVVAMQRMVVNIFYPDETTLPAHAVRQWMAPGDTTVSGMLEGAVAQRLGAVASGLEVETSHSHPVIVAFGDSITEGVGSTPHRGGWPEALNRIFVQNSTPWTVLNAGIGGNRLRFEGSGPSALGRLDADVFSVPNARCLIVLEGINDIGRSALPAYAHQPAGVDDITSAYRQIIERGHPASLRVVGATLTPFEGAHYFTEAGEATRQAVNAWIRTSGAFDAVLDFDAALRDRARPTRLAAPFDSGDQLHPSDAGYEALASIIQPGVCG